MDNNLVAKQNPSTDYLLERIRKYTSEYRAIMKKLFSLPIGDEEYVKCKKQAYSVINDLREDTFKYIHRLESDVYMADIIAAVVNKHEKKRG